MPSYDTRHKGHNVTRCFFIVDHKSNNVLLYVVAIVMIGFVFVLTNCPTPVRADTTPVIDYAPSSIQNGQSMTINGSGFGDKSPALPRLWDDFEGHTVGTPIETPVIGYYTRTGYTKYSDTNCYAGNRCAISFFDGTQAGPGLVSNWIQDYPDGVKNAFASMKLKLVGNTTPSNIKLFRLNSHHPDDDATHGYPNFNIGKERTAVNFNGIVNHGNANQVYVDPLGPLPNYEGWNSLSIWDHIGDWDAPNGWVGYTWGATTQETPHNIVTLRSGGADYLPGIRSAFFGGYLSYEGYNLDLYLDDVYADITLARIEIGDSDNYFTCTNREMQLPTAWDSLQITATINQGSFTNGESAYLYVVDANGIVNTTGYPITFAGESDCTPAWDCSDWSICTDSLQTRSCHDDNNCGTDAGRPVESAECDSTAPNIVSDLR